MSARNVCEPRELAHRRICLPHHNAPRARLKKVLYSFSLFTTQLHTVPLLRYASSYCLATSYIFGGTAAYGISIASIFRERNIIQHLCVVCVTYYGLNPLLRRKKSRVPMHNSVMIILCKYKYKHRYK